MQAAQSAMCDDPSSRTRPRLQRARVRSVLVQREMAPIARKAPAGSSRSSALRRRWRKLSNAPDKDAAHRRFRVIHPFHPLFGREFELLTYRHNWGEDRVFFHDEAGTLKSIPAGWTSAVAQEPFVVVAAGRSYFRVADLCALADLVRELGS